MSRPPLARAKLLDAAITLVRQQGFAATSVEAVCGQAGVSKGAFFHHFTGKEEMGVAAAQRWSEITAPLFAAAPYHDAPAGLARVLAYLDFRKSILQGSTADFTCFAGTMVQELHCTSDAIRAAADASISGHAATLEADFAVAIRARGLRQTDGLSEDEDLMSARSLALHTQVVLQGAFILAKAQGGPAVAATSIDHLKRYLTLLFSKE